MKYYKMNISFPKKYYNIILAILEAISKHTLNILRKQN